MTDFRLVLADLRRPRLLIRAARFGIGTYQRDRDLRRLIDGTAPPERSVPQLLWAEERVEETRRAGDSDYSVSRHVDLLVALIAEVSLLPRPARPA